MKIYILIISVTINVALLVLTLYFLRSEEEIVSEIDSIEDVDRLVQQENGLNVLKRKLIFCDQEDYDMEILHYGLEKVIAQNDVSGEYSAIAMNTSLHQHKKSREYYLNMLKKRADANNDALISMCLALQNDPGGPLFQEKLNFLITQSGVGISNFKEYLDSHGLKEAMLSISRIFQDRKRDINIENPIESENSADGIE